MAARHDLLAEPKQRTMATVEMLEALRTQINGLVEGLRTQVQTFAGNRARENEKMERARVQMQTFVDNQVRENEKLERDLSEVEITQTSTGM